MSLISVVVAISDAPIDSKCVSRHCQEAAWDVKARAQLVDPCDDFYTYACGHYADVPAHTLLWDNFQQLQGTMDTMSMSRY